MKKVVLVLGALVMVMSGVATVSAYEAHIVNVKVHVENALDLSQNEVLNFGTVFPQEWLVYLVPVRMSDSFCKEEQLRVDTVDFRFYLEEKPGYPWLGDALYLQWGSVTTPASAAQMTNTWSTSSPPIDPPIDTGITGNLTKPTYGGNLWVGLDVPVFEGYYNVATDPTPKPSGRNTPTVSINSTDTARYFPDTGVELAANIKIQIERIYKK